MKSSLPLARREVKPLDCRTNLSSLGQKGQVERGIIKEVYETLYYTFYVADDQMPNEYRQAESLLYTFPVNIMRRREAKDSLKTLRAETDCHAQNYGRPSVSTGTHSDPVSVYHAKVEMLELRIAMLTRKIEPVQYVRDFLMRSHDVRDSDMFIVMDMYYFERMKLEEVAALMRKSPSTLARRRQELIGLVMREIENQERE